ncbi:hypothetical protein B7R22_17290 [Subtercola boreus]|uniref:Uncharacterized protein n=1 Tax=Subtercola boreus TaxID=120213 RepID=A0A3E0VQB4_9MICO|nr:hypothetical protein [Subtercola boreus]RFA12182.1 hypothetical protein B7R22_17290 [Subtercola boreus]
MSALMDYANTEPAMSENGRDRLAASTGVQSHLIAINAGFIGRADDFRHDLRTVPVAEARRHPQTDAWLAHVRPLLFAMAADQDSLLSYKRVGLAIEMLSRLMVADSIYPSVSPDGEGGLSFQWSSGQWLLELDLENSGEYFLLQTDEQGVKRQQLRGEVHSLPIPLVKSLVAEFTDYVESLNPAWREYFD